MVPTIMKPLALLSLASAVIASPCPYGSLAERGILSKEEADNFFAARSDASVAMDPVKRAKRDAEHHAQAQYYKRQTDLGELLLGGGLVNGLLQPFTGILQDLDIPTPQEFSLARVPDAAHPYVKPGATDVRGMCPTLNTMANHGYIAHNGITTFAEAANACQITLGFGYDTCVFLSGLGLLAGGDLPSGKYSIGGADARVPNTLGPSLGISHHGFFEIDNSISREDAYFGNQANFSLTRFNELVDIANKYDGQFGNTAFAEERVLRYNQAKNNNPQFDAGIRWLAVSTAERVFIFRAMPNGTEETNANYDNVAPFYMNETFPYNWFRRDNPYSLVETGADIVNLLVSSSELTVPGQNEGVDNFIPLGIDLGSLTAAQATCFLATTIFDETPGFLAPGLIDAYDVVTAFLNGAIKPFFAQFNCDTDFGTPGPNAGTDVVGPSASCSYLQNGKYQC